MRRFGTALASVRCGPVDRSAHSGAARCRGDLLLVPAAAPLLGGAAARIEAVAFRLGNDGALATAERWRQVIDRAHERGELIGADPERFPLDIGVYGIFHPRLKATIPARYPLPGYLTVDRVARFVAEGDRYRVRWIEEDAAALARGEGSGAAAPNRVAEVLAGQAGGARGGSRVIAS